jgi:hypothetical protein
MKRLLREAWMQAKEKVTTLYKAVAEGMYRVEGNKLYAPDGTWIRGGCTPRTVVHGVSALARFPDVSKLPRERLELLQLGWRASDEGKTDSRPFMGTTQPWQVFAWTATSGEIYICYFSQLDARWGECSNTGHRKKLEAKMEQGRSDKPSRREL